MSQMVTKIQTEQDVNVILDTLVAFGQAKIWTEQHLGELTRIPKPRVADAVHTLVSRGYITIYNDEWRVTQDGLDHHGNVSYDPRLKISPLKFREEALTGSKEAKSDNGYMTLAPTDIESAAIPGTAKHYPDRSPRTKKGLEHDPLDESPEDAVIRQDQLSKAQNELAKQFDLSVETVREYLASGKIRTCNGFGVRLPHMGLFSKKGERWQHLCKACTKAKKGKSK
jgi:hypothetical protein